MSFTIEPTVSVVVNMPPLERMFLWAIRAWSASHADLTTVWWSLDRAFAQEGMHAALPPFHQLMSTLFAGLKRWPDIRCVACAHVGRDEASLLRVLTSLQDGNELSARAILNDLVVRSAARLACARASECIQIMRTAGLHFDHQPAATGAFEPAADAFELCRQ